MSRRRRAFLEWPGPIPFAHRGGAGDHPENTLPAFAAAVAMGYHHLETDVHVSRDGVVFAFHDDALDRVTDRRGRIEDLTAAEIDEADAGYTFTADAGATFPWRGKGIRVPRFEDVLGSWPSVRVNIDPKTDSVVDPLMGILRRMNAFDRVCIGAFSDSRLRRVRRLARGGVCTSMGPRAVTAARLAAWLRFMPRLGADCLQIPVSHGRVRLAEPGLVRAAHRSGLQVHIWTVDGEAEMNALLDMGVDGLMTDAPAVLRNVLQHRRQWHG
jgi:glycerophosphoryl diester phosphodiesterase